MYAFLLKVSSFPPRNNENALFSLKGLSTSISLFIFFQSLQCFFKVWNEPWLFHCWLTLEVDSSFCSVEVTYSFWPETKYATLLHHPKKLFIIFGCEFDNLLNFILLSVRTHWLCDEPATNLHFLTFFSVMTLKEVETSTVINPAG